MSIQLADVPAAPPRPPLLTPHPASFRDPSGFMYRDEQERLLRQVNHCYRDDYDQLKASGLYAALTRDDLLIEHEELPLEQRATEQAYRVLQPSIVPFVSYPYEWAFGALRAAALLTLDIQLRALRHGMTLKDANAYNVQFVGTRPVLIDTLSLERYEPGTPWVAYGQFCRHFLAPLALMAKVDVGLNRLMALHLDGVPLDLAAKLLPRRTRFNFGLLMHLHLHAKMLSRYRKTGTRRSAAKAKPHRKLTGGIEPLVQSLRRTIEGLNWNPSGTEWIDYYDDNSYSEKAFRDKQRVVERFVHRAAPRTVWDLGANTGVFSRIASQAGAYTLALDVDPACVQRLFVAGRAEKQQDLLPLCIDLTNPSAGIGWEHGERSSLTDRGPCDLVLALAVIHHLAISGNVPLSHIARQFSRLGEWAVVEFVPKQDPQVQRLLRSRRDIFRDYHPVAFESAVGEYFDIIAQESVGDDGRVLYLLRRKS